jgi:hypothetical protein
MRLEEELLDGLGAGWLPDRRVPNPLTLPCTQPSNQGNLDLYAKPILLLSIALG